MILKLMNKFDDSFMIQRSMDFNLAHKLKIVRKINVLFVSIFA